MTVLSVLFDLKAIHLSTRFKALYDALQTIYFYDINSIIYSGESRWIDFMNYLSRIKVGRVWCPVALSSRGWLSLMQHKYMKYRLFKMLKFINQYFYDTLSEIKLKITFICSHFTYEWHQTEFFYEINSIGLPASSRINEQ